ncbi:MAG: hypothetical protein Q4D20_06635 [Clostridia bacterium]|nr:hypothetical protein [Clostridia bacterium]
MQSGSNAGLFAINDGTIKNVTVKDASVTVSTQGGVISGVNKENGVISNCTVSDSIVAGTFTAKYSTSYRYWLNDGYQVGGIVGLNKGTVSQCINSNTDVRGWLEVGGIVGHNDGVVSQCASSGDINSTNSGIASNAQVNRMKWAAQSAYVWNGECAYGRAGGIAGYNGGEISDVFVSGSQDNEFVDIAGWNSVGGLCGKNEGSIKNAYSVGTKFTIPAHGSTFVFPSDSSYSGTYTWTSDVYVHPMTASQEKGTTENSFYAEIVNGSIPAQATKEGKRGNEKTIDEMKEDGIYKDAGWDFDNVWKIDPNTKLPTLQFIPVECKHANTEVVGAKDATCTEDGYTGDTVCKDCGEVIAKGDVIPATGHVWGEWVETKKATCTEAGEATRTCSKCGATETKEIPATGHHDDDKDGKCDGCGKDMQDLCDHVWGEWVETKKATCTEAGEKTRTCSKCGKTETEVIPAKGHNIEVVGKKDATCEEPGYTGDEVCKDCGATVSKGEVIPAKGHNTEVVGKKDATCEDEGYTGDEVCKDCGKVVSKGEKVPAKGHNDANGDGKCDDCGKDIGGGNHDHDSSDSHKGFAGFMNWLTRLLILVRHLLNMV